MFDLPLDPLDVCGERLSVAVISLLLVPDESMADIPVLAPSPITLKAPFAEAQRMLILRGFS